MKNYNEMNYEEIFTLRNKSFDEMTEEEMIQYCAYFRDAYNVDDYYDISLLCERLAKYLRCYLKLDNGENVDNTEDNLILTIAFTLDAYSTTFDRLFRDF